MGGDTIGKVNVNFLSGPARTALFAPTSLRAALGAEARHHRDAVGQGSRSRGQMESPQPLGATPRFGSAQARARPPARHPDAEAPQVAAGV